jgi:hypothetical protein
LESHPFITMYKFALSYNPASAIVYCRLLICYPLWANFNFSCTPRYRYSSSTQRHTFECRSLTAYVLCTSNLILSPTPFNCMLAPICTVIFIVPSSFKSTLEFSGFLLFNCYYYFPVYIGCLLSLSSFMLLSCSSLIPKLVSMQPNTSMYSFP